MGVCFTSSFTPATCWATWTFRDDPFPSTQATPAVTYRQNGRSGWWCPGWLQQQRPPDWHCCLQRHWQCLCRGSGCLFAHSASCDTWDMMCPVPAMTASKSCGATFGSVSFSVGGVETERTQTTLHQRNLGFDDKICFFTILKPFIRHMSYQQTFWKCFEHMKMLCSGNACTKKNSHHCFA